MRNTQRMSTQTLVMGAVLTALVVILQLMGTFVKFGPFAISLVLIPIVVGAAMYGPGAGAMLGGVFSVVVLLQPDTAFFYGVSFAGTVITVLAKGILAGLLSGLTFQCFARKNLWLAVIVAAMVCPVVNTGLFALGSRLFFWSAYAEMGGGNAMMILMTVMIGFNFIAELAANIICAPIIVRILHAAKIH